jgi:hypothetical protein
LASGETRRYRPDGRVATSWIFSNVTGLRSTAAVINGHGFIEPASGKTFGF